MRNEGEPRGLKKVIDTIWLQNVAERGQAVVTLIPRDIYEQIANQAICKLFGD